MLSNLLSECGNTKKICKINFIKILLQDKKWQLSEKQEKPHPAGKKCCGREEIAIWYFIDIGFKALIQNSIQTMYLILCHPVSIAGRKIFLHLNMYLEDYQKKVKVLKMGWKYLQSQNKHPANALLITTWFAVIEARFTDCML